MSKQLLAKVGVLTLIVVNLGAYYVFWPGSATRAPGEYGKAAEESFLSKGEPRGKPVQLVSNSGDAEAQEPGKSPSGATPPPLAIPDRDSLPKIPDPLVGDKSGPGDPSTVVAQKAEDTTLERLKKLKETMGKDPADKGGSASPKEPSPVAKDPFPPLPKVGDSAATKAVASENSPWTLQWERAGGQTTLLARLHKRIEFRIVCDGVKMETPDGPAVAVGKVSFTAPGLKGTCNRLTLSLNGDSLVLEGKAELQVQQGGAIELTGSAVELKGEQLTLRLQPPAGPVTPAQAFPTQPFPAVNTPMPVTPAFNPSANVPGAPTPAFNPSPIPPSPFTQPMTPPRPFPLEKK
jgi:hypothetical protein